MRTATVTLCALSILCVGAVAMLVLYAVSLAISLAASAATSAQPSHHAESRRSLREPATLSRY